MREIKTQVLSRKEFKDTVVKLSSGTDTTKCHRSATTGRLTYLSGSVALFIRHDDLREGR